MAMQPPGQRVLVLGGDGFCGWPCALHLSGLGHQVSIVDDFSRRRIATQLGAESLTPIAPMPDRLAAWQRLTGHDIGFARIDIAGDYDALRDLIAAWRPDVVLHLAEQRSAPYSMMSPAHRRATVQGNVSATHNVLVALVETGVDAHLVHIGSIGVYGYSGHRETIPEGYHSLAEGGATREVLYPTEPGSIYHLTKAQDQLLFAFYSRHDGLRITDLHQGIVWGTQTEATLRDPALINRFDYDGIYGTVLNRFLLQAALDEPLSVHGSGGQMRGFIHLADMARSIDLVLATPPPRGARVRIINQVGEVLRLRDLAERVAHLAGARIAYLDDPREEAAAHSFPIRQDTLRRLGLTPRLIGEDTLRAELEIARAHAHHAHRACLPSLVRWR